MSHVHYVTNESIDKRRTEAASEIVTEEINQYMSMKDETMLLVTCESLSLLTDGNELESELSPSAS
jgi:hypothetical protein